MRQIRVFTSSAFNYFPKVRLLCQSLKRHHPEWHVSWAVADRVPAGFRVKSGEIDEIIPIDVLDIPHKDGWIFCHDIAELSTAIKPFVALKLLAESQPDAILFFDPDIVLFSRLDDLVCDLDAHSILLTPHQTRPESKIEAVVDNEICSLRHGVFNLGFLGIRNDENGRAFLQWWADRLYHFCYEALDQHLWTDQKWVNFAPIFFEGVKILKSSRFNVAPWNITTRHLEGGLEDGFRVDGAPLGFYHFTGFDSGAHRIMATKYAGGSRAVMELVSWYEREGRRSVADGISQQPWAYSKFDNGDPITKNHRYVYRLRRDLQLAYPNPFAVEQTHPQGVARSYQEWFQWRAAEEYPELFSATHRDGTGMPPADRRIVLDQKRLASHLRLSLRNRQYAFLMLRRTWQVVRTQGVSGLLAKLFCYSERPI